MPQNTTPYVCANAVAKLAMLAACCNGWISFALPIQITGPNSTADRRIIVAVIDSAHVAGGTRVRAEQDAGRILASAGISVGWIEIDANVRSDLPAGAIVLRILPEAGPSHDPNAVGVALAPALGGIYASIFFDRVRERAMDPLFREAGANLVCVMGHVIAHEIGHLLLGTNSHSESGLMSAVWTVSDMRRISKGQFNFWPDESARMRREVARRNGPSRMETAKAR